MSVSIDTQYSYYAEDPDGPKNKVIRIGYDDDKNEWWARLIDPCTGANTKYYGSMTIDNCPSGMLDLFYENSFEKDVWIVFTSTVPPDLYSGFMYTAMILLPKTTSVYFTGKDSDELEKGLVAAIELGYER